MAQDVGTVYVQVVPSGKGFGKTVEGQITQAADSGSAKGSTSILSKIGGAFKTVGKVGLGAIATVATGIVGLAAKGGFERALNIENAQAKLKGLGHDTASVQEIMNDALASVKGTAFGLGDAATVAASLSASGVQQGAQLTKVLKTVADTAQISGRSLTDIGTIFGSVAARGKLQGDDMLQLMSSGVPVLQLLSKHLGLTSADVSDMVSKGKIDFQTFADAMQEGLGGAAQSAGTTFTGAWANVKAALSRTGEQVATPILNGLRGLFNQAIPLIDSFTATATPIMQRVGGALQSGLEGVMPALQSFFSWLSNAVSGLAALLGQGDFTSAFHTAFNVEEDAPIVDFLLDMRDAVGNLIGAVGNLIGSMAGAAPAIMSVISPLGNLRTLIPPIIDLLAGLTNMLSGVISFVGSNANWLAPLATGIAGVVAASKGLGAVSTGLAGIPKALSGITAGANGFIRFITLIPELGGFIPALKSVASGMTLVKNAQLAWNAVTTVSSTVVRALGAAIAANPIGAIIVGITAVVAALTWFFTQTETGKRIWAGFMSWLQSAWQSVSGFFSNLWAGIVGVFNAAVSGIQNAWSGVTGFFQSVGNGIRGVWDGITGFFSNLWAGITNIFTTAIGAIGGFLKSGWGQAILFLINPIAGIVNFIVQHFNTIKTIITNVLIVIAAIWVTIWNGLVTLFTTIWNGLVAFFTPIIVGIQTAITTVLGAIQVAWATVWGAVSGFFIALWNGLVAFFTPIMSAIGSTVTGTINGIQAAWNAVWGGISGFFTGIWNAMVGFIAPIIQGIANVISSVVGKIRSTWQTVWNSISSFFSGIWNGMVGAVSGFITNIGNTIGGIKDAVMKPLKDAGSWLKDVGGNIIKGLIGGIEGAFKWLKDTITGMGDKVLGWAKGVLGIHSPSRVFRAQVGYNIGAGMALGIDDSMKTVRNSVRQMSSLTDQLGVGGSYSMAITTLNPAGEPQASGTPNVTMQITTPQVDWRLQARDWGRQLRVGLAGGAS